MTTSRGDWLTLGALTALTAGVATRGRGGRNAEDEKAREVWSYLLKADVKPLNATQLKGLSLDVFLMPDGDEPDLVKLLSLEEARGFSVRSKSLKTPTVRGQPRFRQFRLLLEEEMEPVDLKAMPFVLAMNTGYEWSYYLVPENVAVRWDDTPDED